MTRKRLICGIAAFAAVSTILSGCYFFPEEEKLLDPPTIAPDEVAYSTFTARNKTIESAVSVTGYVRSRTEIALRAMSVRAQKRNVISPATPDG